MAVCLGMQGGVIVRGIIYCVIMCPLCSWSGQVKVAEALYDVSYPSLIVIVVNS